MGGAVLPDSASDEGQPLLDVTSGAPVQAPSPPPARMGRQKRITSEPMLVNMETGKRTNGFGSDGAAPPEQGGWRQYVTGKVRGVMVCVRVAARGVP